jgi:hypothetical protein
MVSARPMTDATCASSGAQATELVLSLPLRMTWTRRQRKSLRLTKALSLVTPSCGAEDRDLGSPERRLSPRAGADTVHLCRIRQTRLV